MHLVCTLLKRVFVFNSWPLTFLIVSPVWERGKVRTSRRQRALAFCYEVEGGCTRVFNLVLFSGTGITGWDHTMEMSGRSTVPYLVRTLRVPFVVLILIGLETKGPLVTR